MVKLKRLGVLLAPEAKEAHTFAKFNAGMVMADNVIHMVYRYSIWRPSFIQRIQSCYATDDIRYALLTPDGKLLYEAKEPLVAPSLAWDYSGCQDARIVPFEGAYYLIYCSWDKDIAQEGLDMARVGFARTYDFVTCEKLGIISHYTWDKDAYIFPERINGKIAYVHRVQPNIQIDYFDSFKELLDLKNWEHYEKKVEASTVMRAEFSWECGKVGGSVPPIKTEKGWLFIYHAVEVFFDKPFHL